MNSTTDSNKIEVRSENVEPPSWLDAYQLFVHAVLRALKITGWEVSILFTDDERMRVLNRDYRGRDESTDVLSFAALDDELSVCPDDAFVPAGDIVIDLPQVERQARAFGVPGEQELRRMTIHGVLHLAGHDHTTNNFQEEPMLLLQERILDALKERIY